MKRFRQPPSPPTTMRPALRRARMLILALLFVSFFAPLLLFSNIPSPSLNNKEFIGGFSGIVRNFSPGIKVNAWRLNSIKQELVAGQREPAGIVYKDKAYRGWQIGRRGSGKSKKNNVSTKKNTASTSAGAQKQVQSNQTTIREHSGGSRLWPVTDEKIREMEDQLIMAKAYLLFAPPNSNSHLVRELRQRIKETDRVLGQASKDSDLSRSALQKMRAMQATLTKANRAYPDCSAMASKLRAMTENTEEQLRAQQKQASHLTQIATRTFPKGLHCLSMQLTAEFFTLQPEERKLPNSHLVQKTDLYHYAIFSDNILACAVVVNSTISTSLDPAKVIFHVVTDSLNFPAMTMWFLLNPPGQATIQIQSLDDFKWLPSNFGSKFRQQGVQDPRYTSPLNHLRFYLPEVLPSLKKVLLLDHDVVVKRDLGGMWSIDMKGKVNGAVEMYRDGELSSELEMLANFSDPIIANYFDGKSCLWAFGMNLFDLEQWRRRDLTKIYHNWLQEGQKRELWKAGSLPLGQLVFYNHTVILDQQWHLLGLGRDSSFGTGEIERAAVIHYDGNLKPWLEIGNPKYRDYWNKFVDYDNPYLRHCNIHE